MSNIILIFTLVLLQSLSYSNNQELLTPINFGAELRDCFEVNGFFIMGKLNESKYKAIIGAKYEDWVVISSNNYKCNSKDDRSIYWLVQCKCGKKLRRTAYSIVSCKTKGCKSCDDVNKQGNWMKSYLKHVNNRAKKQNFTFNLTLDYIESIYTGVCVLSGEALQFGRYWSDKVEQTASLDRIDSIKGYVKGNVQWVHKDVNFMKGVLKTERFLELCKKITILQK